MNESANAIPYGETLHDHLMIGIIRQNLEKQCSKKNSKLERQ